MSNLSFLNDLVGLDAILKLSTHSGPDNEGIKINGLKKLKILTVRRLANLNFLGSMDALLELSITFVSGRELKEHDLSNIVQRFKNLQKLNIRVIDYSIQAREYAEIVENVFQTSATRIKIVFNHDCMYTYLTKEPFQKCVLKKLCDACGSKFERFGPPAAKPIRYIREGIKDFNCIICDKNQDLLSYFKSAHKINKPNNGLPERICCNEFEYRLSMRDKSL